MLARRSFAALMGADPAHDCLHAFETSWAFSPLILFCARALISLYVFTSTFFIFGWNGSHGADIASRRSFSFFTHLTFWGVAFYFLVAALHTFLYHWTGRSVLLDKLPRWLRALHVLFYSTVVNFPFLVTIIYWAMLFSPPWFAITFDAWTNVSLLNSLLWVQHAARSTQHSKRLTTSLSPGISPHPPLRLCPLRNRLHNHLPATLATRPLPPRDPPPVPCSRLPHPRHAGLLHVQLSGPRRRRRPQRPRRGLLLCDLGMCRCAVCGCVGPDLASETDRGTGEDEVGEAAACGTGCGGCDAGGEGLIL